MLLANFCPEPFNFQTLNVHHKSDYHKGHNPETSSSCCLVSKKYTLFQNGRHLNILLFLFKLALDASFLSLKFKRIFYLERSNKGHFVSA